MRRRSRSTSNENLPETHQVLKQIRAELEAKYPDRMLLAEANLWPEDIQQYFGDGDECHMAFHFPLMPRMYMAIAQEDRFPIVDILRQMPDIPASCQWAIFLRNHDELTLEMVTDQERDYLWNYYAADKRARINLGIRRRLAPLVERDRRRIELLNSLLLSMPGTPTLYYGDEIGMGDNIFLGDRHGVRTPMQWSDDRNGGFSRADPASLIAPTIMDPLYGFQAINVEAQAHDTHSLLNWTRRMLAVRKQQKAFGRGNLKMLAPANRRILAYVREYTSPEGAHEIILCVANVSRAAQAAELDLSIYAGKIPVEMVGGTSFPAISKLNYVLSLPPYGFYWFMLADETQMPNWYVAPVERMPELTTLIVKHSLLELAQLPAKNILEKELLPPYLSKCPWFATPGEPPREANVLYVAVMGLPEELLIFAEITVIRAENTDPGTYQTSEENNTKREGGERYFLPLGFVADHLAGTTSQQLALARLRRGRTAGLLTDAFSLVEFNRQIIRNLLSHAVVPYDSGEIQFFGHPQLTRYADKITEQVDLVSTQEANGGVVLNEALVLKPIRKVTSGVHPEIEITGYLSDSGFSNIAPLLGEIKRVDQSGDAFTLMVVQGYVDNQGDAWQWTQNTLERALRDRLTAGTSSMDMQYPAMDELENFAAVLGQRLGEMHAILGRPSANPRFSSVTVSKDDAARWANDIVNLLRQVLEILRARVVPDGDEISHWLLAREDKILRLAGDLAERTLGALRMRIHGNLFLGQIWVVRGDAYFANFEDGFAAGDGENDLRYSPFKDVADMLCSLDDAAAMAIRNSHSTDVVSEYEHVNLLITSFRFTARTAFYDGYCKAINDLPDIWQHCDTALSLFNIANRAREIIKARHSADWLPIPLLGLYEMLKVELENN